MYNHQDEEYPVYQEWCTPLAIRKYVQLWSRLPIVLPNCAPQTALQVTHVKYRGDIQSTSTIG